MRGYLVLFLLGEQIARDMQAEGVDASSVLAWLENWNRTVEDGFHASPGNAGVTTSLLGYRLKSVRQMLAEAVVDDDE